MADILTTLVTDLLEPSNCLLDDLIIVKLDAYGLKNDTPCLILNFLNNRKQRIKIISSFISFQNIVSGSSTRFFVGPLVI